MHGIIARMLLGVILYMIFNSSDAPKFYRQSFSFISKQQITWYTSYDIVLYSKNWLKCDDILNSMCFIECWLPTTAQFWKVIYTKRWVAAFRRWILFDHRWAGFFQQPQSLSFKYFTLRIFKIGTKNCSVWSNRIKN